MPSPPTTTSASGLVFTAARADSSSSTQLGSVSDCTSWPSARSVCTSAGPISDLAPNDADGLIATTTRFGLVLVSLKMSGPSSRLPVASRYWLSEVFGAAPRLDGMTGAPFQLELEAGDDALVDELVAQGAERIGIDGLLTQRGRRIWRAWTRGSAARHGFRWSLRDTFDGTWWPQGIDVAEHDGRRAARGQLVRAATAASA